MKKLLILLVFVAAGCGVWWVATERGWFDGARGVTDALEDKQDEDFAKPSP